MFCVYTSSVQLCNTSTNVTRPYLSTCDCSHQTRVGQPGHANAPSHARSVMALNGLQTVQSVVNKAGLHFEVTYDLSWLCSTESWPSSEMQQLSKVNQAKSFKGNMSKLYAILSYEMLTKER